jgi:hypothetical protein
MLYRIVQESLKERAKALKKVKRLNYPKRRLPQNDPKNQKESFLV